MHQIDGAFWSAPLKQFTRDVISGYEMPATRNGGYYLKHIAPTRFAFATYEELCTKPLTLHLLPLGADAGDGDVLRFADVEALLQAGWVLD